jgi:RND family efflux transporter MFP subunit
MRVNASGGFVEPCVPRVIEHLQRRLLSAAGLVLASGAAAAAAGPGHACLIEPFQRIELRSSVEARIDAIHVDRGSEVKPGQVLVSLDSAAEKAALDGARFRAVMEGQLKTAESRVVSAKEKFRRRDELVKERYITAQERDDALGDLQVAEASLVEAKDNRRLAAIEERRINELLEQRRIRSPFTGVVTERLQHVGEIAQAGASARPILRLAQTNPLRVEVVLPVALYGQIRAGMKGVVVPEAPLTGRHQATVAIVDRVVDSASGTFGVRLELPNPKGDIPAGVQCRVTLAVP